MAKFKSPVVKDNGGSMDQVLTPEEAAGMDRREDTSQSFAQSPEEIVAELDKVLAEKGYLPSSSILGVRPQLPSTSEYAASIGILPIPEPNIPDFIRNNISAVASAFIAKHGNYWSPERQAEEAYKYTAALAERLKTAGILT